jgi:capsular polysaccharide biosynthesis protein
MSDQPLDLRRSLRLVWRHKLIVATVAAVGLAGGAGYAVRFPATLSSSALVVLPSSTRDPATQAVVAGSDPVLAAALPKIEPDMTLDSLRGHVHVDRPTPTIISITAQGRTIAQAERAANAVARSYIAFASARNSPAGTVQPHLLQRAMTASGTPVPVHVSIFACLGLLLGLLIGAVGVLALTKHDRRLRRRDDIADAIGVPVLASLAVRHPSNPAAWTRLFEDYQPNAADSWRLRKALQYMDLADVLSANGAVRGSSLTVLSVSSDPKAIALGPQLALFAASLGIPTSLVVGPQQDPSVTAALHAVCAAGSVSPGRLRTLRLIAADRGDLSPHHAGLSIAVSVVDGQTPQMARMVRTSATVLGVSAGTLTADQMARVAASAAADGRHLAGILVADPDPGDHTTGRVPQLSRLTQRRLPSRVTGIVTRTRA